MEAISWITRCVRNGAGEVVLNSIDTDGVKGGFDLPMLEAVSEAVDVPVILSLKIRILWLLYSPLLVRFPEKAKVHGHKSVDFLISYFEKTISPTGWLSQSK